MDDIDAQYIWQRRIHSGIRYQKGEVPFPESAKIGLDFNVSCKRKEKLDSGLLTNGVILDICDFAKAVTKAEKYFACEILEHNFDLGMNNDKQRYDFVTRVYTKVKLCNIRNRPQQWKDAFVLPDPKVFTVSGTSALTSHSFTRLREISEKSALADSSRKDNMKLTSSEHVPTDSNGVSNAEVIISKQRGGRVKQTKDPYPMCKKIGLDLVIRPKDAPKSKLDLSLLTKGVIREVLSFAKFLCGTHCQVVFDVLEHNFDLNLEKSYVRPKIIQVMDQRNAGLTPDLRVAFRKEPFIFQAKTRGHKWKRRWADSSEDAALATLTEDRKRRQRPKLEGISGFSSFGHLSHCGDPTWQDSDLSYLCPLDTEGDMQLGPEAGQERTKMESSCTLGTATAAESEIYLSPALPWSNAHGRQPRDPVLTNTTQEATSGLLSEDMRGDIKVETAKLKLWKRRGARIKHVFSMPRRTTGTFTDCRKIGLDFNVGSGVKRNINLQLLTNGILFEVAEFAKSMTRTRCNFISEFLGNNFSLDMQDKLYQRSFLHCITEKVKILLNHPRKNNTAFLSSVFELPIVYNMVKVTSDFLAPQNVPTEQQTGRDPPSAPVTTKEASMEPYPFCNKLGLNLWSVEQRPMNKRLDLTLLTNGAMLELIRFSKELRGTVLEIIYDVLEHNFDVDLQSGETSGARHIQEWYAAHKHLKSKRACSTNEGSQKWETRRFELDGAKDTTEETRDQEIKSEGYPLCREIGLDLDVGSKPEAKAKLDLQVLTRAVVYEMHKFVEENSEGDYVPALYEILQHNFDLSSQSHRRREFALSIASQVKAMVEKFRRCLTRKIDYPSKVFELPFEFTVSGEIVCKEEPEFDYCDLDPNDNVLFVQQLVPVEIEVELE